MVPKFSPSALNIAPSAVLLTSVVAFGGRADFSAQLVAAICMAVLIAHLFLALGMRTAVLFILCCLPVTFLVENIGVKTGFPFGHYHFLVSPELPRIGAIPLIVGGLYLSMGYASWVTASLILGTLSLRSGDPLRLFALPIAAAIIMVQWDAVMDPSGSTLGKAWAWHDSGGYFGVPLSNFFGWFLVNYLFFQVFSGVQWLIDSSSMISQQSSLTWTLPVALYLAAGLSHLPPLLDGASTITDAGGRSWQAADLRETAAIVMMVTMLPTSLLALLTIVRRRSVNPPLA